MREGKNEGDRRRPETFFLLFVEEKVFRSGFFDGLLSLLLWEGGGGGKGPDWEREEGRREKVP